MAEFFDGITVNIPSEAISEQLSSDMDAILQQATEQAVFDKVHAAVSEYIDRRHHDEIEMMVKATLHNLLIHEGEVREKAKSSISDILADVAAEKVDEALVNNPDLVTGIVNHALHVYAPDAIHGQIHAAIQVAGRRIYNAMLKMAKDEAIQEPPSEARN